MIKYFTKLLGIDRMPRWLLIHLSVFSLALGGIQAILFIVSFSGFISEHLFNYFPEAIAISGFLGVLLFGFFKFVKNNLSYRLSLLYYFLLLAVILLLEVFIPRFLSFIPKEIFYFITFFPISFINQIIVVEICENVTYIKFRQNLKRYTETLYLAGAATVSACILIAFKLGIHQMVFFPALILLVVAGYEADFVLRKSEVKKDKNADEEIDSVITLFSDIPLKFTLLVIFSFITFSVANYVIVNYIFLDKVSVAYSSERSVIFFLGMYYCGLMGITVLFKTFVYQNLIKTFRLNKAVLLSPVFMIGTMLILNVSFLFANNPNWNYFSDNIFIVIVFAGFFNFLLRESFEVASLRMVFSNISFYSQKLISNNLYILFVLWGLLFSGLVLLLIMSADLFKTSFLIYTNSGLVALWVGISFWLLNKYDVILLKISNKLSGFKSNNSKKSLKERVMLTTNLSGLKYLLNYQRYYQPFDFQKNIDEIPTTLQDKLGLSEPVFNPSEYSTRLHEPTRYQRSDNGSLNYYDSDVSLKLTDIEALASSVKIKDRIRAIRMIENSNNFAYAGIFKMLIRDSDEEVRRNALLVSVRYYNNDILSEILKHLDNEEFSTLIAAVLAKIGNDAIPSLSHLFQRVDTDFKIQIHIIKIMGKIGTPESVQFLLEKLVYPNKWVVKGVIEALDEMSNETLNHHEIQIEDAVIKIIGSLAWILAKDLSLTSVRRTDSLIKALDEEYNFSMHLLFDLLFLKYQDGVIQFLNENLDSPKNNEQLELQVELLGRIVSSEIKVRLFALLHNNQKNEKIEQLKRYFPVNVTSAELAIKDLVTADYEYISSWTKACALKYYISNFDKINLQEVIAHLFNPNILIAELVLFFLTRKNPDLVSEVSDRIPYKLKNRLVSILKKGDDCEYSLIFNKVQFLQKISYFQGIMGHNLIPFAECLHDIYLDKGDKTYLKCTEEEILPVFFSPKGEIGLVDVQKRQMKLNKNYIYGLGLYAGGIELTAFNDSVLFVAQPEQIGYLVIHYEELSEAFFKYTQNSNFY